VLLLAAMLASLVPLDVAVRPAAALDVDHGALEQGIEVALAVQQQVGFVDDEAALDRLYALGARVAYAARDDATLYSFYLIDMEEPNAFAVPGGFIFMTRGMLELELDDDALAHLLGHEIAHVRNRHASRMGFWATITSVLQAAVVIGATIAASGSTSQRPVYEDELGNVYTRTGGGAVDALAGASVFSTVFRELFLRGYSRKLEMEADDEGTHLATAAGFDPEGGVTLLETLHDRIYEDSAYSYWRTHPFFTDRVRSAAARLARPVLELDAAVIDEYRRSVQAEFTRLARRERREDAATLLYRDALHWGPGEEPNASIQLELIRFRLGRESDRPELEQRLGPLRAELDTLATRLEAEAMVEPPDGAATGPRAVTAAAELRPVVRSERDTIAEQLDAMLPRYLRLLDTPGAASNDLLEAFVDNFPAHPRAGEARLALARRALAAGRPDDAVPVLHALLGSAAPDSALARGRELLARCAAEVTTLASCYEIIVIDRETGVDQATRESAMQRLEELVDDLDDLEAGARFLRRWPDTAYDETVRARIESLAGDEVRFGRVYEAGGKPQQALDIYNRVVLLAPDSEAAERALRGIERIQQRAEG
jgi:Zn-dependent protease with chaperone function/tetratricopeptide (TPR) repeat protein